MLNNENDASGVGTKQFQAFPLLFYSNFRRPLLRNLEFGLSVDSHSKTQAFAMSHTVVGVKVTPQQRSATSQKA